MYERLPSAKFQLLSNIKIKKEKGIDFLASLA